MWDWWWNINNIISFQFRLFPETTNDKIFQKIYKILLWGYFGSFFPKFSQKLIFLEKRVLPVFKYSNYLLSCKKLEKKLMEKNARIFSKNSTTKENMRICRLKNRLRNLCNKENLKPDLSKTLHKPLTATSLAFLKAFDWVD